MYAPTYGVYISQLIRYSRVSGSYKDFLDRGLLLTRKLLNQGFLLVMLKSILRKFYDQHHVLVDRYGISVSQMSSFCTFTFGHCVICSSSIYGFWLLLWYLQALLSNPVISREWGKDWEVHTTSEAYPAAPTYGVYISQLIRYSRVSGSYKDFLDRGLLLTRKLLNQGFLLVAWVHPWVLVGFVLLDL
jgi:hypothetical protein